MIKITKNMICDVYVLTRYNTTFLRNLIDQNDPFPIMIPFGLTLDYLDKYVADNL